MRSVTFVLYVIDDLTNRPVAKNQLRAYIPGMPPPVCKDGGWICFLDLPGGSYTVILEGPAYQRQCVAVHVKEAGGEAACPVITVRMMPGVSYRLPENTVCLFGQAPPGSTVRVVFKPEGNILKLLYDYEKGKLIRIFSTEIKSLDGRGFCVNEKEFFTIVRTVDENERIYLMDRELLAPCKRGKTKLYLTGRTTADTGGNFLLAARCFGRGKTECIVDIPESGGQARSFILGPGEKQYIRLDGGH